ncbi:MAG: TonB-dependent receptor [Chitinophagaceae bacterium]|nr:TonB-dependent receptor [Chitinophagaceae bacterium]
MIKNSSRGILRGTLIYVFTTFFFLGQTSGQASQKTLVRGKVMDSLSSSSLGLASVRIFNSQDKKLANGNLTTEAGDFSIELPPGTYYAEIEYMGYKSHRSSSFNLTREKSVYDLGNIRLVISANTLDEVVVQAEKSSMELTLDKKIFNVGKDLANAGGSASDILTNIPSVTVDPEGNVRLRGSDNVRILIDGKPSGLVSIKGGSGLQQLQANMIERVEIITNPSARYEAEGMAGIINIILKKDKKEGFNGSVELVTGYPTNLGAAANFNYRHKKINFFINYGIAYRRQPGKGTLYQELYDVDTTFILKQNNKGRQIGFNNNIRGGMDYYLTDKDVFTASYLYRRSKGKRITDIHYEDYLFNTSMLAGITKRRQDEDETEPNSEYSLNYKKSFTRKGHELIAEIKYIDYWENSDQLFTQYFFQPNGMEDASKAVLQRSLNDEFEKQWLFQVDYMKPIGEEGKFETGLRSSFRNMVNDYVVSRKDNLGIYVPLPGLDNIFVYDENIHAAYGILGNKSKKISYQAGLRAEWTDVKTTLKETNQVNPRNYVNLFPSAHFTFSLPKENALQLSYSRRVRRPFYNDLSPFVTYSDSRNFFSGNPDLEPEFSNSIELGHLKSFEKGSLTASIYYRSTKGKIDRIRTVNAEGNSVTRTENLLTEKAFGTEFTSGYSVFAWWKLDFNLNFFYADVDGSNIVANYKTTTYTWFARQTSRFMFPKNFDVQLRGNYEAPQKTVQGRRKALYYADFSMSKDVFKGKGTMNFNVLDVFNTRKMRTITNGSNFYTDANFQNRRRQINLTLSYRIRQAKQAAKALKPGMSEEG